MPVVKEIRVGAPADDFDCPTGERITIQIHNASPTPITSPVFTLAGYTWSFVALPFDDHLFVNLCNLSPSRIRSNVDISLKIADRVIKAIAEPPYPLDDIDQSHEFFFRPLPSFYGKELTFVINIMPDKMYRQPETPSLCDNILKLFGDEETSDLAFQVDDTTIHAHKFILKVQAPELFLLSESFDKDTPMPITDVKPLVFEMMLKYIYGNAFPFDEWKENVKQIMEASNKYGFSRLRSDAEDFYVNDIMNLTVDNAIDELLYADGSDFKDVKKAVLEFIAKNGRAVGASPSFSKLHASAKLTRDVMMEMASESKK